MTKFVRQVDFVYQIIELGHFAYRKFNEVTLNIEDMEELLDRLQEDLTEW